MLQQIVIAANEKARMNADSPLTVLSRWMVTGKSHPLCHSGMFPDLDGLCSSVKYFPNVQPYLEAME